MSGQCLQRHSSSKDRIKLRIEAELQPSDLKNCSDLNIFGNTELIDPQSIPGVCLRRNLHNSSSREVGLVCQRGSNTIQQIRRRNFNTLDSPNGIDPSSKVSTPPPPRPARSQKRLPLAECTRSIEDVSKLSTPLSLRSLNENLRGLLKTNKNQRSTREIYIQPKLTQGDERNRTLTFDSTLTSTGDTSQMFHTPISRVSSDSTSKNHRSINSQSFFRNLFTPENLNQRSHYLHTGSLKIQRSYIEDQHESDGGLRLDYQLDEDCLSADEKDETLKDLIRSQKSQNSRITHRKSFRSTDPSDSRLICSTQKEKRAPKGTSDEHPRTGGSESWTHQRSYSDQTSQSPQGLLVYPTSRQKISYETLPGGSSSTSPRNSRRISLVKSPEKTYFASSVLIDSKAVETKDPRDRDSITLMAANSEELLERLISNEGDSFTDLEDLFDDDDDDEEEEEEEDDDDDYDEEKEKEEAVVVSAVEEELNTVKSMKTSKALEKSFDSTDSDNKSSIINSSKRIPKKSSILSPILESLSSTNRSAMQTAASFEKPSSSRNHSIGHTKKSMSMSFNLQQLPKFLNPQSLEGSGEDRLDIQNSSKISNSDVTRPKVIRMTSQPVMGSKSTTETSTNQLPSSSIHSTWRSSRTEAEYKILMNTYGQMEMKRQEVIWELFQTEASFLEGLKMVLSTFCRPLQRSTGDWVDGVPKVVGKLYESLEEIVNLHTGICEGVKELSHQSRLGGNHGMILKVADTYLRFIPRLEIYQPYLVRFEEVNQLIEELSSDQNSDFGEFVRMQSGLEECGRMSLSSFLLKPVQRLMKYPLFFKQLCELTPPSHTDSHQTDQLLQSTDSIIQLMQEVKGMEDEYKALKVLENQIKGLPTGFKLAVRDRKLLAEGALSHFKISSSKARAEFEMGSATRSPGKPNSKAMDSSSSTHSLIPLSLPFSITRASFYSRNMQRPLSQISDCSDCSLRSGKSIATPLDRSDSSPWNLPPSINDGSSLRTGSSSQTLDSGSDNSPEQKFNLRPTPPSFSPKVNYGGSTPCNRPNQSRQRTISARRLLQKAKESQVWAFVFSDLMVLCHRSNEGGRIMGKLKYQVNELTAIHHIGLSRVVQVSLTGDSGGFKNLIKLRLLPSIPDGCGGIQASVEWPQNVLLGLPEPRSRMRNGTTTDLSNRDEFILNGERERWMRAFERSMSSWKLGADGTSSFSSVPMRSFSRSPSFEGFELSLREEKIWWKERQRQVRSRLTDEKYQDSITSARDDTSKD